MRPGSLLRIQQRQRQQQRRRHLPALALSSSSFSSNSSSSSLSCCIWNSSSSSSYHNERNSKVSAAFSTVATEDRKNKDKCQNNRANKNDNSPLTSSTMMKTFYSASDSMSPSVVVSQRSSSTMSLSRQPSRRIISLHNDIYSSLSSHSSHYQTQQQRQRRYPISEPSIRFPSNRSLSSLAAAAEDESNLDLIGGVASTTMDLDGNNNEDNNIESAPTVKDMDALLSSTEFGIETKDDGDGGADTAPKDDANNGATANDRRNYGRYKESKHCDTCTCEPSTATSLSQYDENSDSTNRMTTPSSFYNQREEEERDEFDISNIDSTRCLDTCRHLHETNTQPLPPPLPKPKYSFHRRVLPARLISLTSPAGKTMFVESLTTGHAECFFSLSNQFANQSDPAFCGVTTLLVILNAMCIDPNVRWRGGWRYYGDEDVLLNRCCLSRERVARAGITMGDFRSLAKCQGLRVVMKQPVTAAASSSVNDVAEEEGEGKGDGVEEEDEVAAEATSLSSSSSSSSRGDFRLSGDNTNGSSGAKLSSGLHGRSRDEMDKYYTVEEFRRDIQYFVQHPPSSFSSSSSSSSSSSPLPEKEDEAIKEQEQQQQQEGGFLVVSFSRQALHQTGDGHFSPIAAYHPPTNSVLILDVARFKYAPYWVTVQDLYDAMIPVDNVTKKCRGWFLMYPPSPPLSWSRKKVGDGGATGGSRAGGGGGGRYYRGMDPTDEGKRPADIVPEMYEKDICPVGEIKVTYCRSARTADDENGQRDDEKQRRRQQSRPPLPSAASKGRRRTDDEK